MEGVDFRVDLFGGLDLEALAAERGSDWGNKRPSLPLRGSRLRSGVS